MFRESLPRFADVFGEQVDDLKRGLDHREDFGVTAFQQGAAAFGEACGVGRGQTDAGTFEGEADAGDDVDALAHEVVAQLDLEEIALGLFGAVLDGVEQLGVYAGEPGDHAGVGPVAFTMVGVDGAQLAGVGDEHLVAEALEEAAGPRGMRADFQGNAGARIFERKPAQAFTMIGDGALVDDGSGGVEDADGVLLVSEVKADGDRWDMCIHGSGSVTRISSGYLRCLLI